MEKMEMFALSCKKFPLDFFFLSKIRYNIKFPIGEIFLVSRKYFQFYHFPQIFNSMST